MADATYTIKLDVGDYPILGVIDGKPLDWDRAEFQRFARDVAECEIEGQVTYLRMQAGGCERHDAEAARLVLACADAHERLAEYFQARFK